MWADNNTEKDRECLRRTVVVAAPGFPVGLVGAVSSECSLFLLLLVVEVSSRADDNKEKDRE